MSSSLQSRYWKKHSLEYSQKKNNRFREYKLKKGSYFFKKIFNKTNPKTLIEIGSNIGLNIHYIRNFNKRVKIDCLEVNSEVCKILKKKKLKINEIINEDVNNFKIEKNKYDLVMTWGVLIHINPKNLDNVIKKLIRMSKKYILIGEYFSHNPQTIKYNSKRNLLFKKDFGKEFLKHKNIKCKDYGFLWQETEKIFDNINWWLFEKKEN